MVSIQASPALLPAASLPSGGKALCPTNGLSNQQSKIAGLYQRRSTYRVNQRLLAETAILFLAIFLAIPTTQTFAQDKKPVVVTPEMIERAATVQKREEEVAKREEEIKKKTRELEILQKDVEDKVARLTTLQEDIQKAMDRFDIQKDKEFKTLIKVFSEMSATKLAPLLDEMEDESVVRILRSLKTDQVAKILPKMERKKAVRVSELLGMVKR